MSKYYDTITDLHFEAIATCTFGQITNGEPLNAPSLYARDDLLSAL